MRIVKFAGPPGTGKTTRLLNVMEEELKTVRPDRLAYLTFSKKARHEARSRAMARFNYQPADLPWVMTIHAVAYHQLGLDKAALLHGEEMYNELSRATGYTFKTQGGGDEGFQVQEEDGDRLLGFDMFRRANRWDVETAIKQQPGVASLRELQQFTDRYTAYKEREGFYDFTDLLEQVIQPLPVDVMIVDEAQDLSELQWAAVRVLARDVQRLYLAGDDDQACYVWAGASPAAFIDFPADVTEVLAQSYRVPRAVQRVAERVITRCRHRLPKTWAPRDADGRVSHDSAAEYVRIPDDGTTLILARHHYLLAGYEQMLKDAGRVYEKKGDVAPALKWGPAIMTWEALRKGEPTRATDLVRFVEAISKGTTAKEAVTRLHSVDQGKPLTVSLALELCGLRQAPAKVWYEGLVTIPSVDRAYLRAVIKRARNRKESARDALTEAPKIILSTIHGSKGGEADHVFLDTKVSRKVRDSMELDTDSERRVFYVGVTRARETLTIVGDGNEVMC